MTAAGPDGAAELRVGAAALLADPCGALVHEGEGLLVVADLHLEKGSGLAARGRLLPPYDTRATLARLAVTVARRRPRLVVALGDSFHDPGAPERLRPDDREAIAAMQRGRDWLWLAGNHDPAPPAGLGGEVADEVALAGLRFRHAPRPDETAPEIAGHLHPAAKVRLRGRSVRRRCFVGDGHRLVLPAFGAYAGGLNVLDPAFRPLFADGFAVHVLGADRVFTIGRDLLAPDRGGAFRGT